MMNGYCYLVMVEPSTNKYKYYEMKDNGNGTFTVHYGRVGNPKAQVKDYPIHKWSTTYNSKIKKGYVDKTDYYQMTIDPNMPEPNAQKIEEEKNKLKQEKNIRQEQFDLWEFLKKFTKQTIRNTFENGQHITKPMVEESKNMLVYLYHYGIVKDIDNFNKVLLSMMSICPRKVSSRRNGCGGVEDWLAQKPEDIKKIIAREESLIQTMEGQISYTKKAINSNGQSAGYISDTVKEATPAQIEEVEKHLPRELRAKIRKVYRVIPEKKSKEYKTYKESNGITRTKLLWHGSSNENWLSIIQKSLLLKPDAKITGKMFGNGIYFAPDANKSWGYTSGRNSYWAKGTSNTAIMGLFEVAYGNPLECYTACKYTQQYLDQYRKNCVHAKKGRSLYRDEIVFYTEDAMVLKYLVIFDA